MKALFGITGSGFSRSAMTRSTLCLSIATALALPASLPTLAPGAAVEKTAEQTNVQKDSSFYNGTTSERAAASCWEAKQANPEAKSGAYWLYTPTMSAPTQFYCDQETDGGGWVKIAEGRDGWTEGYEGQGDPAQLYSSAAPASSGLTLNQDQVRPFSSLPAATTPVQLSGTTINKLLNGMSPQDLADGYRFRRVLNTSGTKWQEVTVQRHQTSEWTWALRANAFWSNAVVQNPEEFSAYNDNSRRDWHDVTWQDHMLRGQDNGFKALLFEEMPKQDYRIGFRYGKDAPIAQDGTVPSMSDARNSYIYTTEGTSQSAFGYTQMFLRPKLTQNDLKLTEIGSQGTEASHRRALPNSRSATWRWRTSSKTSSGKTDELHTYVEAITEVKHDENSSTVFIGGDFMNLESSSGEVVNQSNIAGFDPKTGELRRDFHLTVNGQVKAVEALPNNRLAVGGYFTKVNGRDFSGFVVVDATTGEIAPEWESVSISNRIQGDELVVKTIHRRGDYVYIGGSFTHVKESDNAGIAYSRNIARFKLGAPSNGVPGIVSVDREWRQAFNGTVNGISTSEDNSHVYVAGYFTWLNGGLAYRVADITEDQQKGGHWVYQNSEVPPGANVSDLIHETKVWGFQFDVQDTGSGVWVGGTEHLISRYNKSDMRPTYTAITLTGGDFQDLHLDQERKTLYGACHCGDFLYQDSHTKRAPLPESSVIHSVKLVAAFDPETGKMLPEFSPAIKGDHGFGIWESFVDSTGALWVGGDIHHTLGVNGIQNTVGFARFEQRDVTPPATPQNLKVNLKDDKDSLTWDPVSDSDTVRYQILRGDRPIATVSGTSYEVDHRDNAHYFVRAVDTSDNYSASTGVQIAPSRLNPTPAPPESPSPIKPKPEEPQPTPTPKEQIVLPYGSTWNYVVSDKAPNRAKAWKYNFHFSLEDLANATWHEGRAPIGLGYGKFNTRVPVHRYRPYNNIYAYTTIDLTRDQASRDLVLTTYADDAVAVAVNGQEVGRAGFGTRAALWNTTVAVHGVSADQAQKTPVTFTVPASQLKAGTNLIAVEVHGARSGWFTRPGVSFDLQATVTAAVPNPADPAAENEADGERAATAENAQQGRGVRTVRDGAGTRVPLAARRS